jgi:hypothetical protein
LFSGFLGFLWDYGLMNFGIYGCMVQWFLGFKSYGCFFGCYNYYIIYGNFENYGNFDDGGIFDNYGNFDN